MLRWAAARPGSYRILPPFPHPPVRTSPTRPQVLPLSINGALAMAQLAGSESADGTARSANGLVSSRQFFFHKFERSEAGLAGLSFDEVREGAAALSFRKASGSGGSGWAPAYSAVLLPKCWAVLVTQLNCAPAGPVCGVWLCGGGC